MKAEELRQLRQQNKAIFEAALKDKIEGIKRNYNREGLNEKQLQFIRKDEAFCKAAEGFVNVLLQQIDFLLYENAKQHEFMSDMQQDKTKTEEQYIHTILEYNQLRFDTLREKQEMKFQFDTAAPNV